jgi:hypothetical protein
MSEEGAGDDDHVALAVAPDALHTTFIPTAAINQPLLKSKRREIFLDGKCHGAALITGQSNLLAVCCVYGEDPFAIFFDWFDVYNLVDAQVYEGSGGHGQ